MKKLWKLSLLDIWGKFRFKLIYLLLLTVISGFFDGMGLALLLPLLTMVGIGGKQDNKILGKFQDFTSSAGLELTLPMLLVLIILVFLVQNLVMLAQTWLAGRMQQSYIATWRNYIFDKYMTAGWPFFFSNKMGDLINILIQQTERTGGAFYLNNQIFTSAIVTLIYLSLSMCFSWAITLSILACSILLFVITRGLVKNTYAIGERITYYTGSIQSASIEFLGSAKLIKATATEDLAKNAMGIIINRLRELIFYSAFYPNVVKAVFEFSAIALLCVLLYAGTQYWSVNPAAILVIAAIFIKLIPRLYGIQQNVQILGINLPGIGALASMAEQAERFQEVYESECQHRLFDSAVEIHIDNLSFSYGDIEVLSNVSMNFQPGSTIGIVGVSGSGKSTLVDCLLRLIGANDSSIKVEGRSIEELPLYAWRKSVGYVSQETLLFHDSIRGNIVWGSSNNSEREIIEASKKAFADDFIVKMPEGYNTLVGDRGIRLSGGQKQRIGLARALLNRPVLLILDEATSALDSESEQYVLNAIKELHGEVTVVSIAHRLSTVAHADYIYVLEEGRVVEEGHWNQLMENGERFKQLWAIQNCNSTKMV